MKIVKDILGTVLNIPFAIESVESQRKKAFEAIIKLYGRDFAEKIEQAVRLESGHFKSGQWQKCKTPGMVAPKKEFPFGWGTLGDYVKKIGLSSVQFSTVHFGQTSEGPKSYIAFPNEYHGIMFFAHFIQNVRGGNVSAWFRLNDPAGQAEYNKRFSSITPKIVNSIS